MVSKKRWWGVVVTLGLVLAGNSTGQEKHGQAELNQSLREAINVGANLYNRYGDHVGCYRVYQGALIAVKPFIAPDLQAKIAASLDKAEMMANYSDRAFELRAVIDEIRDRIKPAAPPKTEEKKAEPKVTEEKKAEPKVEKKAEPKVTEEKKAEPKVEKKAEPKVTEEKKAAPNLPEVKKTEPNVPEVKKAEPKATEVKKAEPKADPSRAQLSGQVTYDGMPLPAGFFVSLVSDDGRSFSAAVQKGGTFQFRTPLAPGHYRIHIGTFLEKEAPPAALELPARYRDIQVSGLSVQLQPGTPFLDVNLVK